MAESRAGEEAECWDALPGGFEVVHPLFFGLVLGLTLYVLSLGAVGVWPAVAVFVLTACCLHGSWYSRFAFVASVCTLVLRAPR